MPSQLDARTESGDVLFRGQVIKLEAQHEIGQLVEDSAGASEVPEAPEAGSSSESMSPGMLKGKRKRSDSEDSRRNRRPRRVRFARSISPCGSQDSNDPDKDYVPPRER